MISGSILGPTRVPRQPAAARLGLMETTAHPTRPASRRMRRSTAWRLAAAEGLDLLLPFLAAAATGLPVFGLLMIGAADDSWDELGAAIAGLMAGLAAGTIAFLWNAVAAPLAHGTTLGLRLAGMSIVLPGGTLERLLRALVRAVMPLVLLLPLGADPSHVGAGILALTVLAKVCLGVAVLAPWGSGTLADWASGAVVRRRDGASLPEHPSWRVGVALLVMSEAALLPALMRS